MEAAVDQYAIENAKTSSTTPGWGDVQKYIKSGTRLYTSGNADILGNPIIINPIDTPVQVNPTTFGALSDVAPADFWSPFN